MPPKRMILLLTGLLTLFLIACTATVEAEGGMHLNLPEGATAPSNTNSYTVAIGGSDSNVGSETEPWRTIQHAADTVQAGDTVQVRGGVYAETVEINVSGSVADGPILFKSYEGETAILDGSGFSSADGDIGIRIENQSYLIIDGFEIRNYKTTNADAVPMGIFITGASHHIQLLNNRIHQIETNAGADGNAHGLAVYGSVAPASIHDILIRGNELHDMKLGNSEALVLNGNVEKFTIRQNRVHDSDNIGIDLIGFEEIAPDEALDQARDGTVSENIVYNIDTIKNPAYGGEQSAAGIYVDGGTRILLERNHVYSSNMGIEIASEHKGRATSYITVRNNLLVRNHIAGLAMGGYDTNRGSTEQCIIINNTFFENDHNQDGNGELWIQFDVRNNVIQNNIFVANSQSWLMTNPYTQNQNNVVDYNLYFAPAGTTESEWQWKKKRYQGFAAYQVGTGNDAHSLFADPLFVDTAASNYRLAATSPAIDSGINVPEAGTVDFEGNTRTLNGMTDLGAYEFGKEKKIVVYLPLIISFPIQ